MASFGLGMIAAYLASMVESIDDYHSVARMSEALPPAEDMISKGLGAERLGCLIGGIFGTAGGYTSYSENIGAIGLTRVASRYVFQLGGALMLFLGGMITAWGAFMATMPTPIIGGLYLAVFGLIAAIDVSVVSMADMKSSRKSIYNRFINVFRSCSASNGPISYNESLGGKPWKLSMVGSNITGISCNWDG